MISKTKIRDLSNLEMKSIRDGFGWGLLKVAASNPDVIALSADLTESVRMHEFAQKYPERFFQTGVAEQNMAGVAAGLALTGKIPYIGSFASFSPVRNYDQIRTSICMMNANVKIVSSHAGFSYGEDGINVQINEDLAMLRPLPNMQIIVPADANQAALAAEAIASIPGPVYLRLGRADTPLLFADDQDFVFGKLQLIREGRDLTIICMGYMLFRAMLAADQLAKQGIDAQIINIHTLKPLDESTLLELVDVTSAIVVAEEAQMAGGLGGAVAELVAKNKPLPIEFIGVANQFGESGTSLELSKSRQLMETDIYSAALKVLARKKKLTI